MFKDAMSAACMSLDDKKIESIDMKIETPRYGVLHI